MKYILRVFLFLSTLMIIYPQLNKSIIHANDNTLTPKSVNFSDVDFTFGWGDKIADGWEDVKHWTSDKWSDTKAWFTGKITKGIADNSGDLLKLYGLVTGNEEYKKLGETLSNEELTKKINEEIDKQIAQKNKEEKEKNKQEAELEKKLNDEKSDADKQKAAFLDTIKKSPYGKDGIKGAAAEMDKSAKSTKDDTLNYYMYHLFAPGSYIRDVHNAYFPEEDKVDLTVMQEQGGRKIVCGFPNEPQNLLKHNCDIPSFGTELFQNVTSIFENSGITGAEKTSSVADWGFGVPSGIPGGQVPVKPAARQHKYTALELFGYNLNYTSYLGEWDHIQVSTDARLMSNIGFWGQVKLLANTLWAGIKNVGESIVNFFTDPFNWSSKSKGFADGAVSVVIDSSDANVVARHAWTRPAFSKTLYNAYYMSDKQVIEKGQQDFTNDVVKNKNLFQKLLISNEDWKVFELSPGLIGVPKNNYDPYLYTEESKAAKAKYDECIKQGQSQFQSGSTQRSDCGDEPVLVTVDQETQFNNWKKTPEAQAFAAKLKGNIDCFDLKDDKGQLMIKDYGNLIHCYEKGYGAWAEEKTKNMSWIAEKLLPDIKEDFLKDNPHYDVSRGISHYVCGDEEGNPIGNSLADYKHLYKAENTRNGETLNPECKNKPRPSISGAKYGGGERSDGYSSENDERQKKRPVSDDTRYRVYADNLVEDHIGAGFFGSIGQYVAVWTSKITNTILDLSFANIWSALKLDKLLESVMTTIYNSIFYPLILIGITLSALFIFYKAGARQSQMSLLMIGKLLGFWAMGVAMLVNIPILLKLVEYYPNKIDNYLASIITLSDPESQLCTATGEKAAVRHMQCTVWEITIMSPWTHGQFGAGYNSLNASNMTNTNQDIVGYGEVYMGGGHTEKNWALFQLSKTKSGTITTQDLESPIGSTSKAMYKLVDLQAGPKNGEKSDSRFFAAWAGIDSKERGTALFWSGVIGVLLMVVIGGLGLAKIMYTLEFGFKLFLLPFYLAFATFPGGSNKLVYYLSNLLGLYIKRMTAVLLIVISMHLLKMFARQDLGYEFLGPLMTALLFAIKLYWKEIMNLAHRGSESVEDLQAKMRNRLAQPMSGASGAARVIQAKLVGATSGAIGGTLGTIINHRANKKDGLKKSPMNMLKDIKNSAIQGSKVASLRAERANRRKGYGLFKNISQALNTSDQVMREEMSSNLKPTKANLETVKSNMNSKYDILQREALNLETKKEMLKEGPEKEKIQEKLNEIYAKMDRIDTARSKVDTIMNSKSNHDVLANKEFTKAVFGINLGKKSNAKDISDETDKFIDKMVSIKDSENSKTTREFLKAETSALGIFLAHKILNTKAGAAVNEVYGNIRDEAKQFAGQYKESVSNTGAFLNSIKEDYKYSKMSDFEKDQQKYYNQFKHIAQLLSGDISKGKIDDILDKSVIAHDEEARRAVHAALEFGFGEDGRGGFDWENNEFQQTDPLARLKWAEEYLTTRGLINPENLKISKPDPSDYTNKGVAKFDNAEDLEPFEKIIEEEVYNTQDDTNPEPSPEREEERSEDEKPEPSPEQKQEKTYSSENQMIDDIMNGESLMNNDDQLESLLNEFNYDEVVEGYNKEETAILDAYMKGEELDVKSLLDEDSDEELFNSYTNELDDLKNKAMGEPDKKKEDLNIKDVRDRRNKWTASNLNNIFNNRRK